MNRYGINCWCPVILIYHVTGILRRSRHGKRLKMSSSEGLIANATPNNIFMVNMLQCNVTILLTSIINIILSLTLINKPSIYTPTRQHLNISKCSWISKLCQDKLSVEKKRDIEQILHIIFERR